jgi:hypothetical protein
MGHLVFRFRFGSGTRTELVQIPEQEPNQVAICQFPLVAYIKLAKSPRCLIIDLHELRFFTSNFVTSHPIALSQDTVR